MTQDSTVTIHGSEWKRADVQEEVAYCRGLQWRREPWVCRDALVQRTLLLFTLASDTTLHSSSWFVAAGVTTTARFVGGLCRRAAMRSARLATPMVSGGFAVSVIISSLRRQHDDAAEPKR